MPPDRVFAQIKKNIRNRKIMVNPSDYFDIIKQHASITHLGIDECPVYNWKTALDKVLKPPVKWHFQFLSTKRFILTKSKRNEVVMQGEEAYNTELGVPKSLITRGKKIRNISLTEIPSGKKIKDEKLKDI